jgi:hypothetical protein
MRICIVQPASNGTMHFSCCSPGLYSGLCCYGWLRTCNIFCEMFIASPVHFYVPPKLISSVQLTTRSRRSHSRSELRSTEVNRGLWLRLNPKSELQLSWQYRNWICERIIWDSKNFPKHTKTGNSSSGSRYTIIDLPNSSHPVMQYLYLKTPHIPLHSWHVHSDDGAFNRKNRNVPGIPWLNAGGRKGDCAQEFASPRR